MKPYSPSYGLSLGQKFLQRGTLGVDYVPSADAPNTYHDLMEEYFSAAGERRPMRVYSGGCDNTVFGSPEANYAFRYMHDVIHATYRLEFDICGEIQATLRQRDCLSSLSPEESRVFLIDVAGQALYHTMVGEFVEDQAAFCRQVYDDMFMIEECYPHDRENEIQLLTRAVRLYVGAFCYYPTQRAKHEPKP